MNWWRKPGIPRGSLGTFGTRVEGNIVKNVNEKTEIRNDFSTANNHVEVTQVEIDQPTIIGEVNLQQPNERLPLISGRIQYGHLSRAGDSGGPTQDPPNALYLELENFEPQLPLRLAVDREGAAPQWVDIPLEIKADDSGKLRFLIGGAQLEQLRGLGLSEDSVLVLQQTPRDTRGPTPSLLRVNGKGERAVFPIADLTDLPTIGDPGARDLLPSVGAAEVSVTKNNTNVTERGVFESLNLRKLLSVPTFKNPEQLHTQVVRQPYVQLDPVSATRILYAPVDIRLQHTGYNDSEFQQFLNQVAGGVAIQDVSTTFSPNGKTLQVVMTLGKREGAVIPVDLGDPRQCRDVALRGAVAIAELGSQDVGAVTVLIKDNTGNMLAQGDYPAPENGRFPNQTDWSVSRSTRVITLDGVVSERDRR